MKEAMPLRGLWTALLTPVADGGGVDLGRFVAHARGLLERGVDGVMPFGTTGEGPCFPMAERERGLEALLSAGIPPERMLAATGCAAFTDTLALTRHALAIGVPRCMVLPSFWWKGLTDEAVFRYYAALIDALGDARLRLYLYHIPQVSGVPISPEVLARLDSAYPGQVAGVKDSGGDYAHTARFLECAPRLAVLSGYEPHLPRLMREGGAGAISGISNLIPEWVAALLGPEVNLEDQARVRDFLGFMEAYPYLPACKAIQAAQSGDERWLAPMPPMLPLEEWERSSLTGDLAGITRVHHGGSGL